MNLHKKQIAISIITLMVVASCHSKTETIHPVIQDITQSVYASGVVKCENQYDVFSNITGIVEHVFVKDGDTVDIGTPLLTILHDAQTLLNENARRKAEYNALQVNAGKLKEVRSMRSYAKSQMQNEKILLERQQRLWAEHIGSLSLLEQRELAYQNAQNNYTAASEQANEMERQLKYEAKVTKTNLFISNATTSDYILKSKIKGKVYAIDILEGEMVSPQSPIAVVGDAHKFVLEMQIDEYDITSVQLGMPVYVVLNSHKDSVFQAIVTKINPMMDEKSKTFLLEAAFVVPPKTLFPQISFEGNVLIRTKKNAMLIPRNYLINDSMVMNKSGTKLIVKTGLKDYRMVEILQGIDTTEELILPTQ